MARRPDWLAGDPDDPARPAVGDTWCIGRDEYRRNPRLDQPAEYAEIYTLYAMFRGGSFAWAGMGGGGQARLPGHLPNPGGAADQSAWLIDAFGVIAAFEAEMFPEGGA